MRLEVKLKIRFTQRVFIRLAFTTGSIGAPQLLDVLCMPVPQRAAIKQEIAVFQTKLKFMEFATTQNATEIPFTSSAK